MEPRVDFVAGHVLQARAGESVFAALKDRAQCRWRIGRGIEPDGAAAVVLMDHTQQNPRLMERDSWKYKFYLMHDLGDVMAYKQERRALRQLLMVFVPDRLHAWQARRYLWPWTKVRIGGWPKYDQPAADILADLPARPTILYAPTWAGRDEWRQILPALATLPVNVVVKNHTYATVEGEEMSQFYKISRQSVANMEAAARAFSPPMIVVPADLNICTLFACVNALITDQSSVAAEFLPWGLATETGANEKGEASPGISQWYSGVQYRPLPELLKSLKHGGGEFLDEVKRARPARRPMLGGAGKRIADMIWEELCSN